MPDHANFGQRVQWQFDVFGHNHSRADHANFPGQHIQRQFDVVSIADHANFPGQHIQR
jgi:hypothetical protein